MLLGIYALCGWLFTKKRMKERVWSKGAQILWLLLFRVVGNLTVLCFLQTCANLMQLVYKHGINNFTWEGVLTQEFDRRSTYCWTVSSANKLSNANIGLAELLLS